MKPQRDDHIAQVTQLVNMVPAFRFDSVIPNPCSDHKTAHQRLTEVSRPGHEREQGPAPIVRDLTHGGVGLRQGLPLGFSAM